MPSKSSNWKDGKSLRDFQYNEKRKRNRRCKSQTDFPSKYKGECRFCPFPINEGDRVTMFLGAAIHFPGCPKIEE